jgi:hypothetical protein
MKSIFKIIHMLMVTEPHGGFFRENRHIWKLMTWHNHTTICRVSGLYRENEPDFEMYVYKTKKRK